MTTADRILDQIDTCLGDYDVSDDAMRYAPDLPRQSARAVVRPRANGSTILIQRLVELHDLSPEEARAAVLAAERGQAGQHADLAAIEARAFCEEVAAQVRAAFEPVIERIANQFRQIKEAFRHIPEAEGCNDCKPAPRRDRPAWQSPYGPPRKRR